LRLGSAVCVLRGVATMGIKESDQLHDICLLPIRKQVG
jgi:hypothetical protein